jgi:hypothetical protein
VKFTSAFRDQFGSCNPDCAARIHVTVPRKLQITVFVQLKRGRKRPPAMISPTPMTPPPIHSEHMYVMCKTYGRAVL